MNILIQMATRNNRHCCIGTPLPPQQCCTVLYTFFTSNLTGLSVQFWLIFNGFSGFLKNDFDFDYFDYKFPWVQHFWYKLANQSTNSVEEDNKWDTPYCVITSMGIRGAGWRISGHAKSYVPYWIGAKLPNYRTQTIKMVKPFLRHTDVFEVEFPIFVTQILVHIKMFTVKFSIS